jgi:hypothetical protein
METGVERARSARPWSLSAFIGGDYFGGFIAIEVCEKYANVGAVALRHRQN